MALGGADNIATPENLVFNWPKVRGFSKGGNYAPDWWNDFTGAARYVVYSGLRS
jgi:hypothetical protein